MFNLLLTDALLRILLGGCLEAFDMTMDADQCFRRMFGLEMQRDGSYRQVMVERKFEDRIE